MLRKTYANAFFKSKVAYYIANKQKYIFLLTKLNN